MKKNSKTQIVIKLKNSNFDETKKLKTKAMKKIKNQSCKKTQT